MLPSTFGGLANANTSDTSLTDEERGVKELRDLLAKKKPLRIPGKAFNIRNFISYFNSPKRVIGL